jgi:hypothetical protein
MNRPIWRAVLGGLATATLAAGLLLAASVPTQSAPSTATVPITWQPQPACASCHAYGPTASPAVPASFEEGFGTTAYDPWACNTMVHFSHFDALWLNNLGSINPPRNTVYISTKIVAAPGPCWTAYAMWPRGHNQGLAPDLCLSVQAFTWYGDHPLGYLQWMCSINDRVRLTWNALGDGTAYYIQVGTTTAIGPPEIWTTD